LSTLPRFPFPFPPQEIAVFFIYKQAEFTELADHLGETASDAQRVRQFLHPHNPVIEYSRVIISRKTSMDAVRNYLYFHVFNLSAKIVVHFFHRPASQNCPFIISMNHFSGLIIGQKGKSKHRPLDRRFEKRRVGSP
jgi:hypothetical protein